MFGLYKFFLLFKILFYLKFSAKFIYNNKKFIFMYIIRKYNIIYQSLFGFHYKGSVYTEVFLIK